MVDITDLSDMGELVEINGQKINVPGVSMRGYTHIALHHPELLGMIAGADMNLAEFIARGGDKAISALIAAGCGKPGDAKAEEVANTLGVQAQFDLLLAILKRTLPRGIGPFVETMGKIRQQLESPEETLKRRAKASLKASNASSDRDIHPSSSGNSHHDSSPVTSSSSPSA